MVPRVCLVAVTQSGSASSKTSAASEVWDPAVVALFRSPWSFWCLAASALPVLM
eukprot:CAMPEP_0204330740 /NCGR_PEP_ID=MMETSP0469-20131031/15162_1 /ASSEMBLY_ACC=CAM_ASM_000384 /TAXON_ID=2969 /ORGANISM="Oxyrrhis marina" /LENGTH=53 /DNA_ID=CAMNT_0051313605 /DNA_START=947 /DNA_END=1108 /DNA_ORIENTATION=+